MNPDQPWWHSAPHAMAVLRGLHADHLDNLAGRPGAIARVRLSDWRTVLGMDPANFESLLAELVTAGEIIREGGFARPANHLEMTP